MTKTSFYKGIIFIEGFEAATKILGQIEYKKPFSLNAQIQTLDCVKEQLAIKTIALGGNAIINFKYGQTTSLLGFENTIKWYGNGDAAILSEETKNKLLTKIK